MGTGGHQAVVFAFLHSSQMGYLYPRLYLRGLDPDVTYRLHIVAGKTAEGTPETASGSYWMHAGVQLDMRGDFQAAMFTLQQ